MSCRLPALPALLAAFLLATPLQAAEWGHYGGDAGGSRFSSLAQITPENVADLRQVWAFSTGDMDKQSPEAIGDSAFETTPILQDGRLYFCSAFNEVIALHPGTGEEVWRYDPEIVTNRRPANQYTCRGVAYWRDPAAEEGSVCAARIFTGTVDARVIALDAATGRPCADFGANGTVQIEPELALLWPGEFQITSAPVVSGGNVIVGSAIGDNARVHAPRGSVRAFDARTGAPAWDFDPIPRTAVPETDTSWTADAREITGHANVWAPMSVDEKRGLVFLPTSSPSPDHYGGTRPGDNRYANSVVALNGATGEVVWHFQTVHHDVWDYDLPAQPSLITLERDGEPVDVVAQVTKTGFMFVLDRETGEPYFGVEERPVPQDGAPGEILSPTQPFPVAPPPFVPQSLSADDGWGLLYFDERSCEKRIASLRSEGLFTPPSLQGTVVYPFMGGGANWGGMSFDPVRKIAVVRTLNTAMELRLIERENYDGGNIVNDAGELAPQTGASYAMTRGIMLSPLGAPCSPPPWNIVTAIDLTEGTILWQKTLGTIEKLIPVPLPIEWGAPGMGGTINTASGLIFVAATNDDKLRAFDVEDGEVLWEGDLPASGMATPMTYEWEGRQYVVVAAGGFSRAPSTMGDEIVAFALPE
ncbi:MAG: pyrroloquinoline quinone-dependent dehydrogenase [Parvibaculaceae bacterium]